MKETSGDLPSFNLKQDSNATSATADAVYAAITDYYREVAAWYLHEKEKKKWASKIIRAISLILAVTGGIVPLAVAAGLGMNPSVGYVLLALAGGLQLADRYFGYSEAWSRYIAVAMRCNALNLQLQVEWARMVAYAPDAQRTDTWNLLTSHAGLLGETISSETEDWSSSLQKSIDEFRNQVQLKS